MSPEARLGGPLNAHVTEVSGGLRGWLDWPGDGLFRPVVGGFAGGVLAAAIPTRRVWTSLPGEAPRYVCAFELKVAALKNAWPGGSPILTCLELGALLGGQQVAHGSVVRVDDLLALGQTATRPWRASGFTAFLKLSLHDQITLVYLGLLARRPTDEEVAAAFRRVANGPATILDLRDDLLLTEAFQARGRISSDQSLGAWCLWEGLADVEGGLVSPAPGQRPLSPLSPYLEIVAARESIASHVSRLALGPGASSAERERWRRRNSDVVAAVVADPGMPLVAEISGSTSVGMIRDWLVDMNAGPTGERSDGRIKRRSRGRGAIVQGPYEPLRPGAYRLTVTLRRSTARRVPPRRLYVAIEVSSRLLRFARLSLAIPDGEERVHSLDFHVTPGFGRLIRNARFEARVTARGDGDLEIPSVALAHLGVEFGPSSTTVPDGYARLWMFGARYVKKLIDRSRRARSAKD